MRKLLFMIILFISTISFSKSSTIHVLVWSESGEPKNIYSQGINGAIAKILMKRRDLKITTAALNDPQFGLDKKKLKTTDVLIWFAHEKHHVIPLSIAKYIVKRVKNEGMGLIVLHSAHLSKPFTLLLNATGKWEGYKDTGQPEQLKIILVKHPIVKNVSSFTIPKTEMYLEPFQVPTPDSVIIEGIWDKRHRSREVMTWTIGKGRIVYIRAGHETYPIYKMPQMGKLLTNAVYWVAHQKFEEDK